MTGIQVIYCRGGDVRAPKVVKAAGLMYGTRHDYKPYMPVYMLDIAFEQFKGIDFTGVEYQRKWGVYLDRVRAHQPALAMTLDYTPNVPRDLMLDQVEQVRAAGAATVMICPKFAGAVDHIPQSCIVAVSVPSTYAGFLPHPSELEGRRLHLLGGNPDQQAYLIRKRYTGAHVVSVDSNVLAYKAGFKQWWSARRGTWVHAPKGQYQTVTLTIHSARCVVGYLHDPDPIIRYSRRIQRCMETLL